MFKTDKPWSGKHPHWLLQIQQEATGVRCLVEDEAHLNQRQLWGGGSGPLGHSGKMRGVGARRINEWAGRWSEGTYMRAIFLPLWMRSGFV